MSWFGDFLGGGGNEKSSSKSSSTTNVYKQLPDYKEATGARENWWDTLQQWGSQPGFGAIAPNWNDIWENAKSKVSSYFQGGPEGPGVYDKIKANLAGRNMSEQPAAENYLQRGMFQEGNVLSDIAVQQAVQEANFGEQGRKTWLGSLQNLSGLKPSFYNAGSQTQSEQVDIGGADEGGGIEELLLPLILAFA